MDKTENGIYLKIAGFIIKINFHKSGWDLDRVRLKRNILQSHSGFFMLTKPKKIDFQIDFIEQQKARFLIRNNRVFIDFCIQESENKIVTFYKISNIEFHLIIRNIIEKLLTKQKGFILHASASSINGRAYVFLGKSGVGKSTIINLVNEKYSALADDYAAFKKETDRFYFYQIPLQEKEWWITKGQARYEIGKFFFLKQDKDFKIEKITNKEYVLQIIIQQFFAKDKINAQKQMKYIFEFVNKLDCFYFLHFVKDKEKLIDLFDSLIA